MSKSPEQKANYAIRREMRLRRHKTALAIFTTLIGRFALQERTADGEAIFLTDAFDYIDLAVKLADRFLEELDETEKTP
jgi:hypothetical protein